MRAILLAITILITFSVSAKKVGTTKQVKRKISQNEFSAPWCVVKPNNLNKKLSSRELRAAFESRQRIELVQILWGELLNPPQKENMAIPLLQYLAYEKANTKENAYFTLLASASGAEIPIFELFETWKKDRTKSQILKVNTNLNELCSVYERAVK